MAARVGPKKVHRYAVELKIQAIKLRSQSEIQTQDVGYALDFYGPGNAPLACAASRSA